MVISLYQPYSFSQLGRRTNQEDCRLPDIDVPSEEQFFFVVCDGVGGCDDGEVASQSVCRGFEETLNDIDWSEPFTVGDFQQTLSAAYNYLDRAAEKTGNRDMATTLTFVCFHGDGCLAAHIGDSRIYQIRPNAGIVYRSSDHSQVNSLVHSGIISPDDADSYPDHSVITRYMEPSNEHEPRCMATVLQTSDIQADDYFLLCTDGVLEMVDDEQLIRIVCGKSSDEEKCRLLASLCEKSQDNNTAYLIHVANVENDEEVDMVEAQDADAAAGKDYTEHDTIRTYHHYYMTEDVEADEPEESLTDSILHFIKKIFH